MHRLREWLHRLLGSVRPSRGDSDLRLELQSHLDLAAEDAACRRRPSEDIARTVRVRAGRASQAMDALRDQRGMPWLEDVRQDVRITLRVLRKNPGYAITATCTLALGIGITVTTFSVVYSVLWRPLPYPAPDRLVALEADARGQTRLGPALDELRDLGAQSRLLTRFATINGVYAFLDIDGQLEHVNAASVSDSLLPLLGAEPLALGRVLSGTQDVVDKMAAGVVVSHRIWRTYLGSDANAIGRRIKANGLDVAVVGVLRADFRTPLPAGMNTGDEIDVFWPDSWYASRSPRRYPAIAALVPGATLPGAQAELDAIAGQFVRGYPRSYPGGELRLWARPLQEMVGRDARPALLALTGAVAFVLLIAWVNVANLLIARAKVREGELAVRRALGATNGRLLRQHVIESVVLASVSGTAGLLAAVAGVRTFSRWFPGHLPREGAIAVDLTSVLFAAGLTAMTTIALGVLPALRPSRATSLRSGRNSASSPRRSVQRTLLVAEVVLTVVPLVAAGLMVRTFINLTQTSIGFDPSHILTAKMSLSPRAYPDLDSQWVITREAVERLRRLPGVSAASAVSTLPLSPLQVLRTYARTGETLVPDRVAAQHSVLPGYFEVVGARLVDGRDFTDADVTSRRHVAIVDAQLLAALGGGAAIGTRLRLGQPNVELEIVGVVNSVRSIRVRDGEVPAVFVPFHLAPFDMSLVVRGAPGRDLGPAVRATIAGLGTGRPLYEIRNMDEYVADSIAKERLAASVLAAFGGVTLLLAAVGLHGTLSYLLSTRRQEFGVRLALGATPAALRRLVSREALVLAGAGLGLGVAVALAFSHTLRGMLYGVAPVDVVTIVAVAALVVAVAFVAALLPAWRAGRVDPVTVLRAE